jgi:regulator of sigma E protease
MSIILLVIGLILFLGLIVAHEWGHFIVAQRGGVEIEEFGIGFPPRLLKKKTRGGWLFTINLLPLGGFVRLKGEHDTDSEKGSLGAASVRIKAGIMAAGVAMNLLIAYVLLVILALIGMPQLITNQFEVPGDTTYIQHAHLYVDAGEIEQNSPAYFAGVRQNDILVSFDAQGRRTNLTNVSSLPRITQEYAGQTIQLSFRHTESGPLVQKTITLRSAIEVSRAKAEGRQTGYLGIGAYQGQSGIDIVRSTWSAPIVAAGVIKQFTVLTFEGLAKAVEGLTGTVAGIITGNTSARQAAQVEASSQVTGPVGIFFVLKYGSTLGYRFILFVVAILSLTLAIMNILPIPALDGGRLWVMLATRAIKKPLSPSREEVINTAGFAFLVSLVILVTIVDVRRFF